MPLFQTAVLNKYLKQEEDAAIQAAYARFRQHFHAPEIQANIRNSKEEQYQEGFLRDLFFSILGYTTRVRHSVTDLESLKAYWFCVSAIGTAGEAAQSDPAKGIAA